MKETRQAIPNEANYQQGGWFEVDGIVTYRCDNCFQHMSLHAYAVKKGKVGDVTCPNCKTVHVDVKLTGSGKDKAKNEIRTK